MLETQLQINKTVLHRISMNKDLYCTSKKNKYSYCVNSTGVRYIRNKKNEPKRYL